MSESEIHLNYMILAHKNPGQVRRMIDRLRFDNTTFYLHVDKKSDITPFTELFEDCDDCIVVKDRISTIWGDISLVDATLGLMDRVIRDGRTGYAILLSGQDYPIKPAEQISGFFARNRGKIFMDGHRFPHPRWVRGGVKRYDRYYVALDPYDRKATILHSIHDKAFYRRKAVKNWLRVLTTKGFGVAPLLFKKPVFPGYVHPYGGSQWWAMPITALRTMRKFIDDHRDYYNFHRYCRIPDEMMFQTIIYNTMPASSIYPSLTYVNFDREGVPLPVTFTKADFGEIDGQTDKLYARKFDETCDTEILDLIDERLLGH